MTHYLATPNIPPNSVIETRKTLKMESHNISIDPADLNASRLPTPS